MVFAGIGASVSIQCLSRIIQRFFELIPVVVKKRQIIQGLGNQWVIRTQAFPPDRKRLQVKILSVIVVTLVMQDERQIIQGIA